MKSGIICIIFGIILTIRLIFAWIYNEIQPIVQFLGFILASNFFIGGLILIKLNDIIPKKPIIKDNKKNVEQDNLKQGDILIAIKNTAIRRTNATYSDTIEELEEGNSVKFISKDNVRSDLYYVKTNSGNNGYVEISAVATELSVKDINKTVIDKENNTPSKLNKDFMNRPYTAS